MFEYQVVCDKCFRFDMNKLRYGRMKYRAGGSYHGDKGEVVSEGFYGQLRGVGLFQIFQRSCCIMPFEFKLDCILLFF